MARKPPKDPSERKPDGLANETETIERALNSGEGKIKFSDLVSGVHPQPGPTEIQVSRSPGANLAPGVPVPTERSGAAHRIAAKGEGQDFPTMGAGPVLGNLLDHDKFMADVHVQPGAGPDDPDVVVHPHDNDGSIAAGMADAIGYQTSNIRPDGLRSDVNVTEV